MFINVSNQLPKTSYIKMMDVWLIFNLILPFAEVLLHTYKVKAAGHFNFFLSKLRFYTTLGAHRSILSILLMLTQNLLDIRCITSVYPLAHL